MFPEGQMGPWYFGADGIDDLIVPGVKIRNGYSEEPRGAFLVFHVCKEYRRAQITTRRQALACIDRDGFRYSYYSCI